ncbi:unnamed protein product [Ectocarpus sp. CCAP 1310/34]|nr:unnamed protein product [Ectocarpus sp. CCAP 1310/34]
MLTNCMGMAFEEDKIMRVKIAKFEQDLQVLKLEADMDASSCREASRMEALRRMEITRGLNQAARDRSRAVRLEKMRWAVRDVRRNVIKRSRKDLQRFRELARAERPLEVKQTLSYEKRRDQERDEEAEVRQMERDARKERLAVREVYDAVVGPAASAAATAAASVARKAAIAAVRRGGGSGDSPADAADAENAAAIAAAAAAAAASTTGMAELGGGRVCRACGGPRFGRTVCAKCGANANSWRGEVDSGGEDEEDEDVV